MRTALVVLGVGLLVLGCAAHPTLNSKDEIKDPVRLLLRQAGLPATLAEYKKSKGIPEEPTVGDYLFPTGRHARAEQEFSVIYRMAVEAVLRQRLQMKQSEAFEEGNEQLLGDHAFRPERQQQPENFNLLPNGFLGPITPNAYGPGINSDATGRPFIWEPQGPGPKFFDPFLKVKPDAYGPGIGSDQYGRPVRPACPPGWVGPC